MRCTWKAMGEALCPETATHPQSGTGGQVWANLCEAHHQEMDASVGVDAKTMLRNWLRAQGGAEADDGGTMIEIRKSATADTRTCDFANTSKETLLESSFQHIGDVRRAILFMQDLLGRAAEIHDHDKITDIDGFHRDFVTGFKQTTWWDNHRKVNRHHLLAADGVPQDVNLIDVLDMICDCVMAGMARAGSVYPLEISDEVLRKAFDNTVELLKQNVVVID